ncbi:MAG TPA: ABC transporter substrate-binding protein [Deinococcales bacterium]|nr:ABC transporter substrate-binding protein [Deinococcales bacterium]
MSKRLIASLAVLALGVTAAQSATPVKIGFITSLTGRFAEFGRQQRAGIDVAVKEVNGRTGGIRIDVQVEDDASDVNKGLAAAEKLMNNGVNLILGAYSSGITKPIAQYLSRQKVPFLVVTSSDDTITSPGLDYVYRLNQPASSYAEVLFDIFADLGVKKVAIIAGSGAFEKSVQSAALNLAKSMNIEVVRNESYAQGQNDFRPTLNGIKALNPDAVFMVSYAEDSVGIMRQVKEVGLNAKVFVGAAAGFALPDFIKGAGGAAEYVITATAWVPEMKTPNNARLYTNLVNALKGGEPSYHAAQAYAGVITAADVMRRAGSNDRAAIERALAATNLNTAYGPISFKDAGGFKNQNMLKMVAQQVQKVNGRLEFVPVAPKTLFTTKPQYPTPAWDKR